MRFWRGKTLAQTRAFLPGHLQTDTHTVGNSFRDTHIGHVHILGLKMPSQTQTPQGHGDTLRDTGMGTLRAQTHTHRRCTRIQTHIRRNAYYSQTETQTCSQSPSEVHTCSARTHGLADAQTCSENTQTHTQARQTDPQTQPFICSRDSCGTPPVCQVPSGVRNTGDM